MAIINYSTAGNASSLSALYSVLTSGLVSAGLTADFSDSSRAHFTSGSFIVSVRKIVGEVLSTVTTTINSSYNDPVDGIGMIVSSGSVSSGANWAKQGDYPRAHYGAAYPLALVVKAPATNTFSYVLKSRADTQSVWFSYVDNNTGFTSFLAFGLGTVACGNLSGAAVYDCWQAGSVNIQQITNRSSVSHVPSFSATKNQITAMNFDSLGDYNCNLIVRLTTEVDGYTGWQSMSGSSYYSPSIHYFLRQFISYAPAIGATSSQALMAPVTQLLQRYGTYNYAPVFTIPSLFWTNATTGGYTNNATVAYGLKNVHIFDNIAYLC